MHNICSVVYQLPPSLLSLCIVIVQLVYLLKLHSYYSGLYRSIILGCNCFQKVAAFYGIYT